MQAATAPLAAAKQLRWLQSLAAGVELCMSVPQIRQPNLLVTNMRGVPKFASVGIWQRQANGVSVQQEILPRVGYAKPTLDHPSVWQCE